MEVVAVLGERLYHAAGTDCHRKLTEQHGDKILTITAALAHEVGMEPCGVCMRDYEGKRPSTKP